MGWDVGRGEEGRFRRGKRVVGRGSDGCDGLWELGFGGYGPGKGDRGQMRVQCQLQGNGLSFANRDKILGRGGFFFAGTEHGSTYVWWV
jgi:hypothetical protein